MTKFGCAVLVLLLFSCSMVPYRIDLSGEWTVSLDSCVRRIILPGSLAENNIGTPVEDSITARLTEPFRFEGKAVYEKIVDVPSTWKGKYVDLVMERTKVSTLIINDSVAGTQNSVSTPHVYRTKNILNPGKNHVKIIVDNSKALLPLGGSHAYSEHTQTNWNGILGEFYLKCLRNVSIENVRVDTSLDGLCHVKINLFNTTGSFVDATVACEILGPQGNVVAGKHEEVNVVPGISHCNLSLKVNDPLLWDEYVPHLYAARVEIRKNDRKEIKFGFRDFTTGTGHFHNNGRTVFLRGKHEGGVFPLTGYPGMKKEDWSRYFAVARSYGINHVRCHSWTPPIAAFEAADEAGVFLQAELPLWGRYSLQDTLLINYMKTEGDNVMQWYGNYPSFVMFALGNELEGDTAAMCEVMEHLRQKDSRHLYALGSNNFYWDPQPHPKEDFFVAMRHGRIAPGGRTDLRASFSFADSEGEGGIINTGKPNTVRNFSQALEGLHKIAIGHETGQYQVYPNYEEIKKYTGVMKPRNLEVFRKRLNEKGMLDQAPDFLKASGALSTLCYREEIEMALRTPGFGGFQLLDLQDYPGQGTALVGILDAFMEPKGIIEREKWTEFCNDVVPLALFPKYCWVNAETFNADVSIVNYGENNLQCQDVYIELVTQNGRTIHTEIIADNEIKQGEITKIRTVAIPLQSITDNSGLLFIVSLTGSGYKNSYNIWVYNDDGAKIREGYFGEVLVTRRKEDYTQALSRKTPVLYIPEVGDITDVSVGGLFITDFWNYGVFKQVADNMKTESSPGTLGLLMNPEHGIFNSFPTDFHTNWQWWNIVKHSRPVILDSYPWNYRPLVQVIDNFDRNHKLGLIFEEPGSNGRALICASNLFKCREEPEVKALFFSIINYLKTVNK